MGEVLNLPMTQTMLDAACEATDIGRARPDRPAQHALVTFKFPRLMVSILDTPEHLSR